MMNDRFDAQLREHLLGTADTSAGDGQLARVVGAVNHTAQRLPLVARLTWFPGRIGPVPTRALQLGLVVIALAAAMIAAAIYVGGHPARSTAFEGWWTSVDAADGSVQTLIVGAGTTPQVQFVDRFATGFACQDDAVKVFFAEGSGIVTDNRLVATFPDGGGCGLRVVEVGPITFTYDASTDTIIDTDNLTWQRNDGTGPAPTRGPIAESPERTSGLACNEFNGAGTYTALVGDNLVVVKLPDQPGTTWSGLPTRFALFRAPCGMGSALVIEGSGVRQVSADACRWRSSGVDAVDAATAAQALADEAGIVVTGQRELSIDGNPAVELHVSIPAATQADSCHGGSVSLWIDTDGTTTTFDPGIAMTIYLIDFNDTVTAITAQYQAGDLSDPNLLGQIDAIIGSLEIKVKGGISG